ncbi:MAG: tRNA(fMet)-specific endonuclease VapC [Methanonatronarchaeales archaeon]|nr:tRNA(fMet)-specific endonuclease VapC [Methanonatronarchaeales archaeon]
MELWEGIHLADSTDREREAVKELLTGLHEAEFDTEAGKRAGEINADLKKRGEPIDAEDAMIAATALTHETGVVTGNPEHFDRIPELDVESYRLE